MDRSRRLWAVFLTLSIVFFLVERGVSDVSVGQVTETEEPFPAHAIVVDDTDTERFATEGDGWEKNGFPVGYRSSVWMHRSADVSEQATAAARWTFPALPAGVYDVYATWVWGKTLPSSIPYIVTSNTQQLLSATVDQQKTPVGPRWEGSMYPWQKLGTVVLAAQGADLTVSVKGASTDTFSADAAMLLPRQTGPVPSSVAPVIAPVSVSSAPSIAIDQISSVPSFAIDPISSENPTEANDAQASSVASSAPSLIGYRCEDGVCRAAFGVDATLQQCEETCDAPAPPPPVSTDARWVVVGPPHASFTSCAEQCAARGGTCVENACSSFQTLWDGQVWTGGQKLKANESLLFHNVCDAQWGNLSPSLHNECCCTGVLADPVCGDALLQTERGEECDDGNGKPGDGCSTSCTREFCGDGLVSRSLGEECDTAQSTISAGVSCNAECLWEYCGDGILQESLGETCDDGNRRDGDGCSPACKLP